MKLLIYLVLYICLLLLEYKMVNSCSAYGCQNGQKAGSGISFHRFPHNNPQHLEKWINAMKHKDWRPNKYSFICSQHFDESYFITVPGCVSRRLKPDAVPTKFKFPKTYMQSTVMPRRSPRKCQFVCPQLQVSPTKEKAYLNMIMIIHHQKYLRKLKYISCQTKSILNCMVHVI